MQGSPKDMIQRIMDHFYYDGQTYSQIIFSDYTHYRIGISGRRWQKNRDCRGEPLAKYIRDNGLGSITETRPIINRNSGNRIKTWVWNMSNIRKIKKAVDWEKPEDDDGLWDY